MVDIDEWIPNFEMFVLVILPTLILFTVAVFFVAWFFNRPKKKIKTTDDWMDLLKFGTALYLIVPVYRIISYIQGNIGIEELIRGMFITDFFNYMVLALLTGIMGLVFILKDKIYTWVGATP